MGRNWCSDVSLSFFSLGCSGFVENENDTIKKRDGKIRRNNNNKK